MIKQYPPDVERLNVLTHISGLLYFIITIPILYLKLADSTSSITIGSYVFVSCSLLLFFFSTLYHRETNLTRKWQYKKADHISIYFMIAGSYTPFMLIYLNNDLGHNMLYIMWGFTILGTLFKIYTTGRFRMISTAIYVLMGLTILWISESFFPHVPPLVKSLIIFGGIAYLLGVIFYLRKSWKYHHPVWHVFVLIGAVCHWWAVYYSL